MPLRITGRQTTNHYDGTSADYLHGNVGDWMSTAVQFELYCIFVATTDAPVTIRGDKIYRLTGSWKDDGFAVGDSVNVYSAREDSAAPDYESFAGPSTITAIVENQTENYMQIADVIFNDEQKVPFPEVDKDKETSWAGLWFAIEADKDWKSFNFKYNQIQNSLIKNANMASKIDGMQTKFHIPNKLATDTSYATAEKVSERSGNSVRNAYLKGNGTGITQIVIGQGLNLPFTTQKFQILFEHQLVGLFDDANDVQNDNYPYWFLNAECFSDNFEIRAYTTENDENTILENDRTATITKKQGDTGWFNERFNGRPNDFSVQSVSWEDGSGNSIPSLAWNSESKVTIVINDPYASQANSRYSFGVAYLPETETDYKENDFMNCQNLCVNSLDMQNGVIQQHTASPIVATITGFSNQFGGRIDVTERHFSISGTTLTVEITFSPNAAFADYIETKDSLDRKFCCWVGLGDPSIDFARSKYVNLRCDAGQMSEVTVVSGSFSTSFGTAHLYGSGTILDQLDSFPEDDIYLNGISWITNIQDFAPLSSFTAQIRLANIVDERTVVLDEVEVPFNPSNVTVLPDGTQEINGGTYLQPRQFFYPQSYDFRKVTLERKPSLDSGNERGYELDIPFRMRWEWWLQNGLIPTDFFDITQQQDGLNNFWYRLQNDPDWKLIIVFLREHTDGSVYASGLNFTGPGGGYDFEMLDYFDTSTDADCAAISKYTTFDYDATPVTNLNIGYGTVPYEGYNLDYNLIKANGLTRLEIDWAFPCYDFITPADLLFAEVCIEAWEGGGFKTMYKLRNDGVITPNNPLVGLTDPYLIDITNPATGILRYSLDINSQYLPTSPYFKISAKIYVIGKGDPSDPETPKYKQRTFSKALFSPLPEPDPCECKGAKECQYEELALADLLDDESYKNDIKGLWYKRPDDNYDVDFFIKDENDVETPLNDSTFGTYYDFGAFINDPDLKGYHLEWRRVLAVLGAGKYTLIRRLSYFGLSTDFESYVYDLKPFSYQIANRTVRLISKMDGSLLDKEVNFKGTEWLDGIRVRGIFGRRKPSIEKETVTTQENKTQQVRADIINDYELVTELLPEEITSMLIEYHSLGNEIWVSDYNIYNHSYKFKDKSVKLESFGDPQYFPKNRGARLTFNFQDRYLNIRKSNCGDLKKTEPQVPPPASPVPPCAPAEYVLKDSNGTTIDTGTIGSGLSADIIAPDGQYTIEDTAGNQLATGFVESDGTVTITIGDTDIDVNGVNIGQALAQQSTFDVLVVDQDGNQVGSWNGSEWEVPAATGVNRATPLPTGQTTSYRSGDDGDLERGRGLDFFNLDVGDSNFFGNEKRFTGITGGYWDESTNQYKDVSGTVVAKSVAFPSDIVIDWQSYNQITGDIIWWCFNTTSSTNWNDAIDGQPYSNYAGEGYNDWYLPNVIELNTVLLYQQQLLLNYEPFDIDTTLTPDWLWSSNTYASNISASLIVTNLGTLGATNKANSRSFIVLRYGNISEL